jgi:phosphinothricin acetyltransferase
MNVRKVETEDAGQIADIYNFYILNTHHTFEIEAVDFAGMKKRISETAENYPFLIYEEADEILGYAYAAPYKMRAAYRRSAEVSIYVKNGSSGKGIGELLYRELLKELGQTDVHALIAGIALPNPASIRLHEKFGFEKVAHFREVGFKLGCWIDVGYWELLNVK